MLLMVLGLAVGRQPFRMNSFGYCKVLSLKEPDVLIKEPLNILYN